MIISPVYRWEHETQIVDDNHGNKNWEVKEEKAVSSTSCASYYVTRFFTYVPCLNAILPKTLWHRYHFLHFIEKESEI